MQAPAAQSTSRRIIAIDVARAIALFAMAIFHFAWDLEFFGYVPSGMTGEGGWRIFARCIASSFLFLVGVSLVLAHRRGVRWRPFLIRLAQVLAGALAITAITAFVTPEAYVYFGILHHIAFASVAGLLFLRLPWWITALAAAVAVILPHYVTSPIFDPIYANWVGLFDSPPLTNDFVPVFPFFGAVLAGIAAANLAIRLNLLDALRQLNARLTRVEPVAFLGRHALAFYLLHQPILFGLVLLYTQIAPPDLEAHFTSDCRRACLVERDREFCERYCACSRDELVAEGLFAPLMSGNPDPRQMTAIQEIVRICSFQPEQ